MNKNKKGFTLVELLAVIVILAVILVIAVPRVMDIINDSKVSTLKTTVELIVSTAEKKYIENKIKGNDSNIKCSDIVKMQDSEYGLCKITFDDRGNATVILNGKENGKFNNLGCSGTKENITCQEEEILPGLNCTFDGELVQGAEFQNNQYTYRYKQEYIADESSGFLGWIDIENDGWGVILTDKTSTEPVNTPVCSYINGKPLVSTSVMFVELDSNGNLIVSQASSIDVSSWETDNVTNMLGMFASTTVSEIKGLKNLETGKVTNMMTMFYESAATTLDLSSFDTSNVTDMQLMFVGSAATTLDLSKFDTSNVTNMMGMFNGSAATTLDLSKFDTSNVTNMSVMFRGSAATTLDLSNFDTGNVTDMSMMFDGSAATTLDLRNFDTSNVTDMSMMFEGSSATTIDLSSFDTSNVTDMVWMFDGSRATTGYAKTKADADKFNDASVTRIPNTLTFTVKIN